MKKWWKDFNEFVHERSKAKKIEQRQKFNKTAKNKNV